MATLPDISGEQRPVPQSSGVASFEPTNWRQVGVAGETVARAGGNLEEAANTIAATNERQDNIVAQSAANSLAKVAIQQQYDPKDGWANAHEGQAVGQQFIDSNTERFTTAAQTIRDGLQTEGQKKTFDQHVAVQQMRFNAGLLSHQAAETTKFNDSTDSATVSSAIQTASLDPASNTKLDDSGNLVDTNFPAMNARAQIEGTIDAAAKRKGWVDPTTGEPNAIAANAKQHALTALYAARVTAIKDGIPGAVQPNPYLAEKLFESVQGQMDESTRIQIGQQVTKAVKDVQGRDTAQSLIFGARPATSPAAVAPAATGAPLAAKLDPIVKAMESGGNQNAVGPVTYTGERATGDMQVMPATSTNPGYGVRPAQPGPDGKVSQAEISRVGHDYLGAMVARYNDPALALAAYNAGPARVDGWIQKFGDPRSGAISSADWAAKIPYAETKSYVTNGIAKLSSAQPGTQAPSAPPTANDLKADLYTRVQAARTLAEQQYPGDTAYADSVASRVESYGRQVIANQQGQEAAARDGLYGGIVGQKGDGSDAPRSIDQLLADPQQKQNWDAATPETKLAIQSHFGKGGGDPPRTPDTQKAYYAALGRYSNDREGFANEDLSPLITTLPHADFDTLAKMQVAARNKQELAADKNLNLQHSMGLALEYALKPIGMAVPDKNTSEKKRQQYDQFTGAFRDQLDQFQKTNGKPPGDNDIVTIARRLTATVQQPGTFFGTTDKKAFEVTPDTMGTVTAKVPDDFRQGITAALTRKAGKPPSEAQVQTAYLLSLRPDLRPSK